MTYLSLAHTETATANRGTSVFPWHLRIINGWFDSAWYNYHSVENPQLVCQ